MAYRLIFDDLIHREVFFGNTPEAAVASARSTIDCYPEYRDMSDAEFAQYIQENDTEFEIKE